MYFVGVWGAAAVARWSLEVLWAGKRPAAWIVAGLLFRPQGPRQNSAQICSFDVVHRFWSEGLVLRGDFGQAEQLDGGNMSVGVVKGRR